MKKKILLVIILLLPFIVKAENVEKYYDLCQEGCTYNDINPILSEIKNIDTSKVYDFVIDIKDGETYEISNDNREIYYNEESEIHKSTISIKGLEDNHPTLTMGESSYPIRIVRIRGISLENIDINSNSLEMGNVSYYNVGGLEHYYIIKNSNITIKDMWQYAENATFENCTITTGSILSMVIEKTYFKDSEINLLNNGVNHGISFDRSTVTFENSTVNTNGNRFDAYNLTLIDSTINGDYSATGKQKYTDSKINGSLVINNGYADFDNVEITKGLSFTKTYCSNFTNNFSNLESSIKNSKISNPNGNAIYLSSRDKDKIKIENTDLSNSTCSIVSAIPTLVPCESTSYSTTTIRPTYLAYSESLNTQVDVYNSKVNCAMTSSNDTTRKAMNMYFAENNTWSNKVVRGTELPANVIELNNGIIYIDHSTKDVLVINVDKDKPIESYFEGVIQDGQVLGEWIIGDESIVKIVDGKIIPLKVGETTITGVVAGEMYTLYLTVTEDMLNPNTKDIVIAIVSVAITLIFIFIVLYDKYKQNKVI